MAVNEVIVTGRVKRRLIDKTAKLWQRLSYWTKASDVEFNDGKDAETKLGDINSALNTLNTNLGGFAPVIDETGRITGYKTTAGADTVFPFKNMMQEGKIKKIYLGNQKISNLSNSGSVTFDCTSINNYNKLNTNNFAIDVGNGSIKTLGNGGSMNVWDITDNNYSYNSSNGILTVNITISASGNKPGWNSNWNVKAYCFVIE